MEQAAATTVKVADAIAAVMRDYGVRFAFGIPGNSVVDLIRACEEHGIRFVLAKSEPAAGFMADAVYQLTGAPSVLITTTGPGMANGLTGIAGAQQERTALIVLSGEIGSANLGLHSHQVFDQIAVARPVTKHAATLNPHRAARQMARALDNALAHPAGPVMFNVPADVSRTSTTALACSRPVPAVTTIEPAQADELRGRIGAAKRPLALIGRGARVGDAPKAAQRFVRAWRMPFLSTFKAKGVVDEHDPLCLGAVGLANPFDTQFLKAVRESDQLVFIGFDPIELQEWWLDAWAPGTPAIVMDWAGLDQRALPPATEIYGTLDRTLAALTTADTPRRPDWPLLATIREATAALGRPRQSARAISPAALFAAVDRRLREDWILAVDTGAHRITASHVIRCRSPGQLMQSNGLASMGYGLPAAIGAQFVHPDRTVVALVGDGCMLMTLGELAVAADNGLPLVVVVVNDASLSLIKVRADKLRQGLSRHATDGERARFDVVGQAFGAHGVRVETLAAFEAAFDEAVRSRRFTVIDAQVDPAEYAEQM